MVKYLSEDWRKEVEARLSAQLTPDKMNNLTSSMNNLYLNCPDGNSHYFFVGFADGKVDSVQVGAGEGPKKKQISRHSKTCGKEKCESSRKEGCEENDSVVEPVSSSP